MKQKLKYFQPRVMHHIEKGKDEYAIHDVYFDSRDQVVTWTADALSPRLKSIEELKKVLSKMLEENSEFFNCGDNQYSYPREDLEYWIEMIEKLPLDFHP